MEQASAPLGIGHPVTMLKYNYNAMMLLLMNFVMAKFLFCQPQIHILQLKSD